MSAPNPIDVAREAWGPDMPDWVRRLADECAATSQNRVAVQLGRSAALVSTVLRRKYQGDMRAVEDLVRGVWFDATTECPVQGTISTAACRDWMLKARTFSNVNSERVRMYRACRGCEKFRNGDTR